MRGCLPLLGVQVAVVVLVNARIQVGWLCILPSSTLRVGMVIVNVDGAASKGVSGGVCMTRRHCGKGC